MPLLAYQGDQGIVFESDLFDHADIDELLTVDRQEMEALLMMSLPSDQAVPPAAPPEEPVAATETSIDTALQQSLELLKSDPEFAALAQSDVDAMQQSARAGLINGLLRNEFAGDVVEANRQSAQSIDLTTSGTVMLLSVDGRTVLQTDMSTEKGQQVALVLQVAMVIIDMLFLVAAIVGVLVARGVSWAQKIKDTVMAIKGRMITMTKQFLQGIWDALPSFRLAQNSARWFQALKDGIKAVALGIFRAFKYAWKTEGVMDAIKSVFTIIFAGSVLQIFGAILSLTAAIITIIGTAGMVMVVALLTLVASVAFLVADSITLADMVAT